MVGLVKWTRLFVASEPRLVMSCCLPNSSCLQEKTDPPEVDMGLCQCLHDQRGCQISDIIYNMMLYNLIYLGALNTH